MSLNDYVVDSVLSEQSNLVIECNTSANESQNPLISIIGDSSKSNPVTFLKQRLIIDGLADQQEVLVECNQNKYFGL